MGHCISLEIVWLFGNTVINLGKKIITAISQSFSSLHVDKIASPVLCAVIRSDIKSVHCITFGESVDPY